MTQIAIRVLKLPKTLDAQTNIYNSKAKELQLRSYVHLKTVRKPGSALSRLQKWQLERDREAGKAGKAAAIAECRERGFKNTSSKTSGLSYCLRHLVGAHEYFDLDVPIRDQL